MKPGIEINDGIVLDMPLERAWELVTDPEVVVACVPGAEVIEIAEDGTIHGALTVTLGPSATRFEGRIVPTFDHAEHAGRLQGQGGDGRGRTRAAIETAFRLSEVVGDPSKTDMAIDSTITVSGALAGFALTGGQPVAKRLLADFAENLARLTAEPEVGADGSPTERVPAPQPLGGFGLLRRAFGDAIARFFGRLFRRSG